MTVSDHDLRDEVLRKFGSERLIGELRRRGVAIIVTDGEALGRIADSIDNLLAAENIPMPDSIAKKPRMDALRTLRDELRREVVYATGENPWADHPN